MTPAKAYEKAYSVSKRLPKLEQIVLTSPSYAYLYALDVIKGRWIEAEDVIMKSSYCSSHVCPQEAPSFPKEKFCPASGQNTLGEGRNADIIKFYHH